MTRLPLFAARLPLSTLGVASALLLVQVTAAAALERPVERPIGAGIRTVELENLVGKVEIVAASSGRVVATVHADASSGEDAARLAESLQVEIVERGDRLVLRAIYPLDSSRSFHYPGLQGDVDLEPSWLFDWFDVSGTHVKYQDRRVRITSRPGSSSPTLWVDFRLELAGEVDLTVKNMVGAIDVVGVSGDVTLDSASGAISVTRGRGKLIADTGSGDVTVSDFDGDVSADTGSGNITLTGVRGEEVSADTGSGDVELESCRGSIYANTGSGDVSGRNLTVGRKLHADTGSGDVRLAGDFAAVRDLVIDTGSGDVGLTLSAAPSVELRISTGSGEIDVDVAAMRVRRDRDEFLADLGTAEGDASIDTGSGDVRIREGK